MIKRIPTEALEASYRIAKEIYERRLRRKEGLSILEIEYGMASNSAADYLHNYNCMREGRLITRTINAYAVEFYLEGFLADGGRPMLRNALNSLGQHFPYYEKTSATKVRKNRIIYERFQKILDTRETRATLRQPAVRHFLQYWKPEQVDTAFAMQLPLRHSGSEQLNRVKRGDVVWIVTVRNAGHLHLIGRLNIGAVISLEEAEQQLGYKIWKAAYHAVAHEGTEEPIRQLSLKDIAHELRFISPNHRDRLIVIGGRVDGKQLQSVRRLTSESALALERLWSGDNLALQFEKEAVGKSGYGDAESRKKVEKAAVNFVTAKYVSEGWLVESVEAAKCGYDLKVKRGRVEKHVEVKGTQGKEPSFIITRREFGCATTEDEFVLCVVTRALSLKPELWSYRGIEIETKFSFEALAYQALPRKVNC